MSTGQQQALARLADFSRRERLDASEQAELLELLVVVSPAEVQRLERRWVLSRIGTILGGLMILPVGLIAAAGAFAFFVYLPVVFWMFVGSFVLYWPATALGIEPLVAFAGLHALAGSVWAYRRLPDSLAGFQALGRRLRVGLAACRGALRATPAESKLTILAHELRLGERGIPRADVLFVDGSDAPELVLRGGERIPIAPGTPRRTRTWLGEAVRVMVSADEVGTVADIPEALVAMRQASPQSDRS